MSSSSLAGPRLHLIGCSVAQASTCCLPSNGSCAQRLQWQELMSCHRGTLSAFLVRAHPTPPPMCPACLLNPSHLQHRPGWVTHRPLSANCFEPLRSALAIMRSENSHAFLVILISMVCMVRLRCPCWPGSTSRNLSPGLLSSSCDDFMSSSLSLTTVSYRVPSPRQATFGTIFHSNYDSTSRTRRPSISQPPTLRSPVLRDPLPRQRFISFVCHSSGGSRSLEPTYSATARSPFLCSGDEHNIAGRER